MLKKMQGSLKENGISLALALSKLISGLFMGLTAALVVKTLVGAGSFAFLFVILLVTAAFLKLSAGWKFSGVLIFDLFCLMAGAMLRMYIYIAPG